MSYPKHDECHLPNVTQYAIVETTGKTFDLGGDNVQRLDELGNLAHSTSSRQ